MSKEGRHLKSRHDGAAVGDTGQGATPDARGVVPLTLDEERLSKHLISILARISTGTEPGSLPAPLQIEEFEAALLQIDHLGLKWRPLPSSVAVEAKGPEFKDALYGDVFASIRERYPYLPAELFIVASYALIEDPDIVPTNLVGTADLLEAKAEVVRRLLITPEFRSEFFLENSRKLPRLAGLDWEIVIKTAERGVRGMPNIAYAIISVSSRDNARAAKQENTFVANLKDLETLLRELEEAKLALEKANLETARQE